ncbi:hypothetical protein F5Y15DRAFT_336185 [Xylariaceae sp. FL0016]|nr:hypothetical protein F5Y15DRAFT_336185 [Xylariaceae sp. FL0016]
MSLYHLATSVLGRAAPCRSLIACTNSGLLISRHAFTRLSTTTITRARVARFSSSSSSNNNFPEAPKDPVPDQSVFKDPKVTRGAKIVVVLFLCIYGTAETMFWYQTIMRWWKGGAEDEETHEN